MRVPVIAPAGTATRIFSVAGARPSPRQSGHALIARPEPPQSPIRSRTALFQNAIRVKTIDVVELTLQGITEDVIRLRDPLEAVFRMTITRIDVRMVPAGQLSEGSFDLTHRGRSADLENDI